MMNMVKIKLDFTLAKYQELCQTITCSAYEPLTVKEYLSDGGGASIILRHDVDREPKKALSMARIEKEYGLASTYYFRMTDGVYKHSIIEEISDLGHEIGYHYEVLDKAKGDFEKAIKIFEKELKEFRKVCDVKTICMHGNPLSKWINKDVWNRYDFREFGIIGETYLSIDYGKVFYLTDTGRRWDSRFNVKDIVDVNVNRPSEKLKSTDDIIDFINEGRAEQICVLTHPNRWNDSIGAWLWELAWQNIKNMGKRGIVWCKERKRCYNIQDKICCTISE